MDKAKTGHLHSGIVCLCLSLPALALSGCRTPSGDKDNINTTVTLEAGHSASVVMGESRSKGTPEDLRQAFPMGWVAVYARKVAANDGSGKTMLTTDQFDEGLARWGSYSSRLMVYQGEIAVTGEDLRKWKELGYEVDLLAGSETVGREFIEKRLSALGGDGRLLHGLIVAEEPDAGGFYLKNGSDPGRVNRLLAERADAVRDSGLGVGTTVVLCMKYRFGIPYSSSHASFFGILSNVFSLSDTVYIDNYSIEQKKSPLKGPGYRGFPSAEAVVPVQSLHQYLRYADRHSTGKREIGVILQAQGNDGDFRTPTGYEQRYLSFASWLTGADSILYYLWGISEVRSNADLDKQYSRNAQDLLRAAAVVGVLKDPEGFQADGVTAVWRDFGGSGKEMPDFRILVAANNSDMARALEVKGYRNGTVVDWGGYTPRTIRLSDSASIVQVLSPKDAHAYISLPVSSHIGWFLGRQDEGLPDIIKWSPEDSTWTVWRRMGKTGERSVFSCPSTEFGTKLVRKELVADLNGDGYTDLLYMVESDQPASQACWRAILSSGDGTGWEDDVYVTLADGECSHDPLIGNFIGAASGKCILFFGKGGMALLGLAGEAAEARFESLPFINGGVDPAFLDRIAECMALDINSDGKDDLVFREDAGPLEEYRWSAWISAGKGWGDFSEIGSSCFF